MITKPVCPARMGAGWKTSAYLQSNTPIEQHILNILEVTVFISGVRFQYFALRFGFGSVV